MGKDIRRWFLPESRAAIASTERVDSHVGAKNYYQRLATLVDRTNEGDDLLFAGWVLTPGTGIPQGGKPLKTLLDDAQKAGVFVRILLPDNPGFPKDANEPAKRELDAISKGKSTDTHQGAIDTRLDWQWNQHGTHHQKAVFLTVTEEGRQPRTGRTKHTPHFFCGGCDVAVTHVREQWCDAMVEIVGQGAYLGANSLEERWNSVTGYGPALRTPTPVNDHTFVQWVRTYPKPDEHAKDRKYAKDGETTVHDLLCHAIDQTERSIYIEDQYFFGSAQDPNEPKIQRLEELLQKKLNANVTVAVVTTREDQMASEGVWQAPKRRARLLRLLTDGLGSASGRFRIYQYKADMVKDAQGKVAGSDRNWVHTKAWVFDDDFAVVGSANVNWQGFFAESELSVGIASKAPIGDGAFKNLVFAKALRMKLQLAHLNKVANVKADSVADWDAALNLLQGTNSPLEEMRKNRR
jgi:phosphatidylserine/phosphatidylglycerophosphate/cardiolipin synthase-like enzyme